MKKRMIPAACAALMIFSLTACQASQTMASQDTASGSSEASSDATETSASTITGKVSSIDGNSVTLQLGELNKPEGGAPGGSGQTPPATPDGSGSPDGSASPDSSGQTPPAAPEGSGSSDGSGQTPPAAPDGSAPSDGSGQTPPAAPDGSGQPPQAMPEPFTASEETVTLDLSSASITVDSGAEQTSAALADIDVDDILIVELADKTTASTVTIKEMMAPGSGGQMPGAGGGGQAPGGGSSGQISQGTAATTLNEDGSCTGETYSSTGDDENALRVDGANVTLTDITVAKTAGASSDVNAGDFYGANAALLATNGASVTITGAGIVSSAQNGNGVFSYGSGTSVTISDSTITTSADNSGGLQTTGGASMTAGNLTVNTAGNSSAAIRSDRGGGTMSVDGGSYTSTGYNSPAVYSTADITVKNAVLTAENSEALVIEGQNSITLENCAVSGNMSDTKGTSSDENVHNIMIYQSMSGDAEVGTSALSITGGTLTGNNGDMIYVTNTHSLITLSGVTIENKETDGYFLLVSGNTGSRGWGKAGSNGAQAEFTADNQTITGDIAVDTVSTLDLHLTNESVLTGTVNIIENAQGGAAVDANAVVTVDSGCTWNLTGDCAITSLDSDGTINYNGYSITLADGTVLSE